MSYTTYIIEKQAQQPIAEFRFQDGIGIACTAQCLNDINSFTLKAKRDIMDNILAKTVNLMDPEAAEYVDTASRTHDIEDGYDILFITLKDEYFCEVHYEQFTYGDSYSNYIVLYVCTKEQIIYKTKED